MLLKCPNTMHKEPNKSSRTFLRFNCFSGNLMYNRLSLQHLVELQIPKVPLEVLGYSGYMV